MTVDSFMKTHYIACTCVYFKYVKYDLLECRCYCNEFTIQNNSNSSLQLCCVSINTYEPKIKSYACYQITHNKEKCNITFMNTCILKQNLLPREITQTKNAISMQSSNCGHLTKIIYHYG